MAAKTPEVYVLGGYQTDFARNWTKENKHFSALMREARRGRARAHRDRARGHRRSRHVGNFAAELYCMQGHLGAFLVEVHPAFSGLPTGAPRGRLRLGLHRAARRRRPRSRPAATTCQAVVGIEQMKTVGRAEGGDFLGTAAWYEHEAKGVEFPFPKLFGKLGDEYDRATA